MNSRSTAVDPSRVGGILAIGALTALLGSALSLGWLGVLQRNLHVRCERVSDAMGGGWVCADGNGYLLVGLMIVGIEAVAGAVALAALLVALGRPGARAEIPALLLLPLAVLAIVASLANPEYEVELDALLIAGGACVAAVAALGLAAIPATGRWRRALLFAALGAAGVGVVLPSGIGALSVLGAGIAGAALLVPSPAPRSRGLARRRSEGP